MAARAIVLKLFILRPHNVTSVIVGINRSETFLAVMFTLHASQNIKLKLIKGGIYIVNARVKNSYHVSTLYTLSAIKNSAG